MGIQRQRMQVLLASSLLNALSVLQTMVAHNEDTMNKFLEQTSSMMEQINFLTENLDYIRAVQTENLPNTVDENVLDQPRIAKRAGRWVPSKMKTVNQELLSSPQKARFTLASPQEVGSRNGGYRKMNLRFKAIA